MSLPPPGPDRTAVVTGAASGIGAASARALAAEGACVACTDIDGDGAEKVAGAKWRQELVAQLPLPVAVSGEARDQIRGERKEDDEGEPDEPGHADMVAAEATPRASIRSRSGAELGTIQHRRFVPEKRPTRRVQ